MKKTHVTIYDLAREMKVSPSTVSRALKGHNSISQEKIKAITKLAKKRNYIPNDLAANLRQNKSNRIGVIINWIDRKFHSSLVCGVEEEVSNKGMNVVITQAHDRYKDEVENAKALINSRVSGLIVSLAMETMDYDHYEPYFRNQIPVVFADRVPPPKFKCHRVIIDNAHAAQVATSHLIDQGCHRIVLISGNSNRENYRERIQGYLQAHKERSLKVDKNLIYEADTKSEEEAIMALREYMSSPHQPDAIFCTSDTMAVAILQYCKKVGIKVPDQLAVMGFNNDPITSIIEPNLTTTLNPAFEIGRHAAKLILDQQKMKWTSKDFKTIYLETELIVRESTMRKKL